MIITLDNNCIIALEKDENQTARSLRELATLCGQLDHKFAVYSYLWLENQPADDPSRDLADFTKRMGALNIGPILDLGPIEESMLLWWIHSVLFPRELYHFKNFLSARCDAEHYALEAVLEANPDRHPPVIPRTPQDVVLTQPASLSKKAKDRYRSFWDDCHKAWNNRRSDVLALGAHIEKAEDGIFVTADKHDFHRHSEMLRDHIPRLRICTPVDAVAEVKKLAAST